MDTGRPEGIDEELAKQLLTIPDADWDKVHNYVAAGGETIEDHRMGDWQSKADQYPPTGPPGISYFRGVRPDGFQVNCLLFRDEDGGLVGILNHYPEDIPGLERKGHGNMFVHPDHRRKGVARELLLEFVRRGWEYNVDDFRMTAAGAEVIRRLNEELRPERRPEGT